ncbi:MAG TPA: hypothetical protein EYQ31_15935 [Candidatus Handelsmanbacteria bacterium]|nr:hypothetical protein [Candidatus Handelsmanbacteria bacterium]
MKAARAMPISTNAANANAPGQVVVSGATDAIALVAEAAEAREIKAVPLAAARRRANNHVEEDEAP